jgi:hypothetical protein
MPRAIPVTIPELTVAIVVLWLVHTPPGVASVSAIVEPRQTAVAPVIADGSAAAVTVMDLVTVTDPHAPTTVYEILVVPAAAPVTIPERPTVAIAVLALLHAPPEVASVSGVVAPTHKDDAPVIGLIVTPGLTVKVYTE